MHKISESQIQKGCLDYLELMSKRYNLYYFRSAAGMVKTDQGRIFKTGKPGVPDITLCLGGEQGIGAFVGLEIKNNYNSKQSELQKKAENDIKKAGGYYYIIKSMEDVKNAIEATLEDMRIMR